ncbi:hypothetical protein D0B54_15385 [Solimonas sp. K1W22B-7]|uniref:limonene-1,2-epoxide hydrolase family protein n=1 Tax=Solimonas sp. K1W22B-7 TaxID=2303331 RepID=UPI000E3315F8|nr:limonene-1,2-epoxide hydrolase family protein [Solimonas sp. K1W22B-7]AXQ29973.1 hypothetical protein D0B54_15385 [Solimonas sp. K1W22B-7]
MATTRSRKVQSIATPDQIVSRFLHAIQDRDYASMAALLDPDLVYTNVSLPTIRGGEKVARLFEAGLRRGGGFGVKIHSIAVNGDTVLTERTDLLKVGPLQMCFWVCGTFRVQDGRIVLWRDYFDWMDLGRATLRGVAGIALPGLRAQLPA